jgi:ketosteroid isomerase-like protein
MLRIVTAAALVLLAAPVFAQQQSQPADQATKQAVESINQKWTEALNEGKSSASLFTPDGVTISVFGRDSGSKMDELNQRTHEMGINLKSSVDDVRQLPGGQLVLATGTFEVTYTKNPDTKSAQGNWLRVLQKEGSDYKILAQSYTRQAPPAAATGSTTPTR